MSLPAKLRAIHPIYRDYSDAELAVVIASLDPTQIKLLNETVVTLYATAEGLPVSAYTDLEIKRQTLPLDKQAAKDKLENEIDADAYDARKAVETQKVRYSRLLEQLKETSKEIAECKFRILELEKHTDRASAVTEEVERRHLATLETIYAERSKQALSKEFGHNPASTSNE